LNRHKSENNLHAYIYFDVHKYVKIKGNSRKDHFENVGLNVFDPNWRIFSAGTACEANRRNNRWRPANLPSNSALAKKYELLATVH